MTLSRRAFLAGLGSSGLAAAAAAWQLSLLRSEPGTGSPTRPTVDLGDGLAGRTLVVVELGGGNDGLNTVIPHANGRYHDLRPGLAITDPIDLDGEIGLHPALTHVSEQWQAGRLAIVEGVGYPDPHLSHFESMAGWHTGAPDGALRGGWVGRYLDGTVGYDEPLAAIGIGATPSPALLGERSFSAAIADASGLTPALPPWVDNPAELTAALRAMAPRRSSGGAAGQRVREALRGAADAHDDLVGVLGPAPGATDERARRGAGSMTAMLELAARLVASGLEPRVVYLQGRGDFDTHQGQAGRHQALLADLDAGLRSLWDHLETAGAADRCVVMTVSEFGRRPAQAATGTDHGTAAPVLVMGPAVRPGRHGAPADLGDLDGSGNLRHTTDFRSVYATVLDRWLGVDADVVLDAAFDRLPFLDA